MRVPDAFAGLVVSGGRPLGTDLAPLGQRESLQPWREFVPRGPLLVRSDAAGFAAVTEAGRLGRLGELWFDVPSLGVDEALDVMVAGAARLVLWHGRSSAELVDAVGHSAVLGWDGTTPWTDVVALAIANDVPILASVEAPKEPGPVEVFQVTAGPEPWRLAVRRVHEPPAPTPTTAADGEAA